MTGKLFEAALYVNLRLAGSQRTDAGKARNVYRKPDETMTVVEDGPGGGCYTRILAPCLNACIMKAHVSAERAEHAVGDADVQMQMGVERRTEARSAGSRCRT